MDLDAVLAAAADRTRRAMLQRLAHGPATVGQLAALFPISRPAVSQHLKVLKDAHLVAVRPQGTRHIYSLDPEGLAAARSYFERFWAVALASYAQEVTRSPEEET